MLPYSNAPFMSPPKTVKYKQIFQGLSVSDVLFFIDISFTNNTRNKYSCLKII